jgi:hypothetical protein
MPSLGEAPNVRGKSPLVTWGRAALRFSKVTRRKGGTIGGRYHNNGYVHKKNVTRRKAFASRLAPTGNQGYFEGSESKKAH